MSKTIDEQRRADELSAAIDGLLGDRGAGPDLSQAADAPRLAAARGLIASVERLGPPEPWLEQRVAALGRRLGARPAERAGRLRPVWAAAGLAAVLLVVTLLTPLGHTALASFMAVFSLGRTEVSITPAGPNSLAVTATATPPVREEVTLDEARARVGFDIPQPAALPAGYALNSVGTYTYPDLPAWIPQPFAVELAYRDDGAHSLTLSAYAISLGSGASIERLNLAAAPIKAVEDVDVNGSPGVLLQLGQDLGRVTWQEVVWEQGDRVLSLWADDLSRDELLRVARSVR